jgi:glycosyltransferase involved in cell wall biosynthesis
VSTWSSSAGSRGTRRTGAEVVLAGPVGPYHTAQALARGGVDDDNPDVQYWREEVEPLVDGRRVRWVGTVAGEERDRMVATARVSLVPIDWEEPGGTAVVESLALGTPVVGFRRGCLPELVEHGRTGLLVDPGDEDALAAATRDAAILDPDDCRREAARRFTPSRMAERYLRLYDKVLTRSGRPVRVRGAAREV